MDNIIIGKTYHENNLIQLKIEAISKFVSVWQDCFIEDIQLIENTDKLINFMKEKREECYVEFGVKSGNYTPAFSMQLKSDKKGYIQIELDMEISDNNIRSHRCSFYINTEQGLLENFTKSLKSLAKVSENKTIYLHDDKNLVTNKMLY